MTFNHYYDITGREILAGHTIERKSLIRRGGGIASHSLPR